MGKIKINGVYVMKLNTNLSGRPSIATEKYTVNLSNFIRFYNTVKETGNVVFTRITEV